MDFKFPDHNERGVLPKEDLCLFYYDILLDDLQGWPNAYDWDTVVNEFKGRLDIDSCESASIPAKISDNQIRFTVSSKKDLDNGSKAAAFFRHLRNAFSHYRINRQGEWYFLSDYSENKKTMYGKINVSLLKELCFKFFDIRETLIEKHESTKL